MASSTLGKVRRLRNGLNKRFARIVVPRMLPVEVTGFPLRIVGEGEGAWPVPGLAIQPGWICYCVGVGINATFDVGLARDFACEVVSLDPTPRSIAYMEQLDYPADRLTFLPVGVWDRETTLRFFAPANRLHSNWSVVDLHGTGEFFEADCKRLSVIMHDLGHDHVDIVKLDIEGSWAAVIDNMLAENVLPTVLCVEFDSPVSLVKLLRFTRRLRARGLGIAYQERENFVFVDEARLKAGASQHE